MTSFLFHRACAFALSWTSLSWYRLRSGLSSSILLLSLRLLLEGWLEDPCPSPSPPPHSHLPDLPLSSSSFSASWSSLFSSSFLFLSISLVIIIISRLVPLLHPHFLSFILISSSTILISSSTILISPLLNSHIPPPPPLFPSSSFLSSEFPAPPVSWSLTSAGVSAVPSRFAEGSCQSGSKKASKRLCSISTPLRSALLETNNMKSALFLASLLWGVFTEHVGTFATWPTYVITSSQQPPDLASMKKASLLLKAMWPMAQFESKAASCSHVCSWNSLQHRNCYIWKEFPNTNMNFASWHKLHWHPNSLRILTIISFEEMLRCCTKKSAPAMAEGYQESTKHMTFKREWGQPKYLLLF